MNFEANNRKWRSAAVISIAALVFSLQLHAQNAPSQTQDIPPEVVKQLQDLTKRVEQLEEQLREHEAAGQPNTVVQSPKASVPAP